MFLIERSPEVLPNPEIYADDRMVNAVFESLLPLVRQLRSPRQVHQLRPILAALLRWLIDNGPPVDVSYGEAAAYTAAAVLEEGKTDAVDVAAQWLQRAMRMAG